MSQLWTIIFVVLLLIAWGLAAQHDRKKEKRWRGKGEDDEGNEKA